MEIKTIITVIIAGMLGAVVFAGLLPVFAETSSATDTFTNNGGYLRMSHLDSDTAYNFVWDSENPTYATIDGNEVFLDVARNITVFSSAGEYLLRFGYSSGHFYLQSVPSTALYSITSDDNGTLTIDVDEGTLTITKALVGDTPTSKTLSFTDGFGVSTDGEYLLKSPTQSAYVLDDSRIYAMGTTTLGGVWYNVFYLDGTIEDMEVTQVSPDPATYTISNISINSSEVGGYIDLSKVENITFTATSISTLEEIECNYSYIIVPYEVTAEKSIHPDGPTTALLNLLPVLIAIGLIVGIAGAIFVKRM